jgi:vitamin B12 transporter
VKLQASVLGTFVADHVRTDTIAMKNKTEFTPTLVASYKPFNKVDFNLRGFYKNIFRMPTLNDLYYTFIGNIKLKPEYTDQYDVGFTYRPAIKNSWLKSLELQVDAYYNTIKDKIVAVPGSNTFRWTMMNLGKVEIHGLDVAIQNAWRLPGDVFIENRISYTYQKAEDKTDRTDTYYGDQIPYIPWHSGSLILNASWKGWNANYSFIYTGERYDQRANIPENYVPEWYTSDFSLSYMFGLKKTKCRLTAEVNNIFNQQFEVVKCYPMPGTNYKFILSVDI